MRKSLLLALVLVFSFQASSKTNDACSIFYVTEYDCFIDGKNIEVNSAKEGIISDSRIKKGVTLLFHIPTGTEYNSNRHSEMLIAIAAICDFNKQMLKINSPFSSVEKLPGQSIYCSRI